MGEDVPPDERRVETELELSERIPLCEPVGRARGTSRRRGLDVGELKLEAAVDASEDAGMRQPFTFGGQHVGSVRSTSTVRHQLLNFGPQYTSAWVIART